MIARADPRHLRPDAGLGAVKKMVMRCVVKKLRLYSRIPDLRRLAVFRALLVFELVVGVCGLVIGTTGELPARANQVPTIAALQAVPADPTMEATSGEGARTLRKMHLSAAEFAAAMRAGEVNLGTWDPEAKAFIVEMAEAGATRFRQHGGSAAKNSR